MDQEIRLQNLEKYYKVLEKLRTGKTPLLIPKNKEMILQFLHDAEIGRTILKGQKRKIKPGRLQRMLGLLLKMDKEWLKKPFNEISEEDMSIFILNLERGMIRSSKGKPYTWETQSAIKKFIRKYYKYLLGEKENYPRLVQFIDTSTRMPEVKSLSKQENPCSGKDNGLDSFTDNQIREGLKKHGMHYINEFLNNYPLLGIEGLKKYRRATTWFIGSKGFRDRIMHFCSDYFIPFLEKTNLRYLNNYERNLHKHKA